jgi:hypothetical protein
MSLLGNLIGSFAAGLNIIVQSRRRKHLILSTTMFGMLFGENWCVDIDVGQKAGSIKSILRGRKVTNGFLLLIKGQKENLFFFRFLMLV